MPSFSAVWVLINGRLGIDKRPFGFYVKPAETKHLNSIRTARPPKGLAVRIEFKCQVFLFLLPTSVLINGRLGIDKRLSYGTINRE